MAVLGIPFYNANKMVKHDMPLQLAPYRVEPHKADPKKPTTIELNLKLLVVPHKPNAKHEELKDMSIERAVWNQM